MKPKPTISDKRIAEATETWREVQREAAEHRLTLRRVTAQHYVLLVIDWVTAFHIYPGTQMIVSAVEFRLSVPAPWTLREVVEEVVRQLERAKVTK